MLTRISNLPAAGKPQAFISYAHKDAGMFERFAAHLSPLERSSSFTFWYDRRRLIAGDTFDEQIQQAIYDSQAYILLVSADFFDSKYIWDHELPAIRDMVEQHRRPVVPVILRRCMHRAYFEGLLAVPVPPVEEWPREDGYHEASEAVSKTIIKHCGLRLRPFLAGVGAA